MGKVKSIFSIILIFLMVYIGARVQASWQQGYSWSEMDWSQKGSTSLSDFFAASDIGKRDVTIENKTCVEYYGYKDGLPIKKVCKD